MPSENFRRHLKHRNQRFCSYHSINLSALTKPSSGSLRLPSARTTNTPGGEQTVFFQQRLMFGRVGGYVDLEKAFHIDCLMHFLPIERVNRHFFAGNAPVGIKSKTTGLSGCSFNAVSIAAFSAAVSANILPCSENLPASTAWIEGQEMVQRGRFAVCALPAEPRAAYQQYAAQCECHSFRTAFLPASVDQQHKGITSISSVYSATTR